MFLQTHVKPFPGKVPTPRDVSELARKIEGIQGRTPVLTLDRNSVDGISHGRGKLYLKLESLQPSGSCKTRGVIGQIFSQPKDRWDKGWVATGRRNYLRAVASISKIMGVEATLVCINEDSEIFRNQDVRKAKLVYANDTVDAREKAEALAAEKGSILLSEYDNSEAMSLGYATMGFEMLLQSRHLHAVMVPMVSGAMASGIGAFLKQMKPDCVVYGVMSSHDIASFKSAEKTYLEGSSSFHMMCLKRFVDELLVVSPQAVRKAVAYSYKDWHLPLEESGALALAGLMEGFGSQWSNENVGVVLSGGNLSADQLLDCVRGRSA
jgi:threonine dehydratase